MSQPQTPAADAPQQPDFFDPKPTQTAPQDQPAQPVEPAQPMPQAQSMQPAQPMQQVQLAQPIQPLQQPYAQQGYQPGAAVAVAAPFGTDPVSGRPLSDKSKLALVLLSFFLGSLGADRFYKGDIGLGVLKLVTIGGIGIWSLVDFLVFAFGHPNDKYGRLMK